MGCMTAKLDDTNIEHRIVMMVTNGKTQELIQLLENHQYNFNINSALNFRGDTLLHYACYKNNKELVKYLTDREEIKRTLKNDALKRPKSLTTDEDIKRMCS